jgi:hypothetical protein
MAWENYENGHITKSNLQIQRNSHQKTNEILHKPGRNIHLEAQKMPNSEQK